MNDKKLAICRTHEWRCLWDKTAVVITC